MKTMNYNIDTFDIKYHCKMMNSDCVCITTGEMCPLCDIETGCYLKHAPFEWDLPRIIEGFEKMKTFNYDIKQFDYI